jgi:arylsulfatase A-like enzyme
MGSPSRLLALAAVACACGSENEAPPRGPFAGADVILLVVDSLHAAHASCYGAPRRTTPSLDALAERGVRFADASSQSSWTLPSVATLFTGLEQERHGLRRLDQALPEAPSTLAELFAAAGYRTAAVVQSPILRSASGLGRGFERYRVLASGNEPAERAAELAAAELERGEGRPLFLYVHLAPPHMPYQPPEPFRGSFAEKPAPDEGSIEACRSVHRLGEGPVHPDAVRLSALYDEHVAFADRLIGAVARAFERAGGRHAGLLVVTSDHGEAFLQHGAQGHNATVYEEMVRVPLVFRARGSIPIGPRVVEDAASLVDIVPTLVELCGLAAPRHELAGSSLAPALLAGERIGDRGLFSSSRYGERHRELHLALRQGRWKLVLAGERVELYDLERDPGERRDVAKLEPEVTERMLEALRRWHREVEPIGEPRRAADAGDGEAREELKKLGYL